jgi:hypothetical protein
VSLALSALVLLLLVLPGFLVVQGFLGRLGRKPVDPIGQPGITWLWIAGLLIAAALHAVWYWAIAWQNLPRPDLGVVLALLSGMAADAGNAWSATRDAVVENKHLVFGYFASIYIAAAFFGVATQRTLRFFRFDLQTRWLRFGNPWHYLLSGEQALIDTLDLPVVRKFGFWKRRRLLSRLVATQLGGQGVILSATVEQAGVTYLYAGFVKSWAYDGRGDLQWIRLGVARRRRLDDDRSKGQSVNPNFYEITGFGIVLWLKDIKTLNVRYHSYEAAS